MYKDVKALMSKRDVMAARNMLDPLKNPKYWHDPSSGREQHFMQFYADEARVFALCAKELLCSPHFHSLNIFSTTVAEQSTKVNELVKQNRLPRENSLEALKLLQTAWDEYDVAVHLARMYKRRAKMLFALQLALAWLVVVANTPYSQQQHSQHDMCITGSQEALFDLNMAHVLHGLSQLSLLVLMVDWILNPKHRWHQLRSSSIVLESTVWKFRTRIGPFRLAPSDTSSKSPENTLRDVLNSWRDGLAGGADLKATALKRTFAPHIYTHFQRRAPYGGEKSQQSEWLSHHKTKFITSEDDAVKAAEKVGYPVMLESSNGGCGKGAKDEEALRAAWPQVLSEVPGSPVLLVSIKGDNGTLVHQRRDDHFSPVNPTDYIRWRLEPAQLFYSTRIPRYSISMHVVRVMLMSCSIVAATLAYVAHSSWVVCISALASAFTSWSEFSDSARKLERYNSTVNQLEKLVTWWEALGEIDKSALSNIAFLVDKGESIIEAERLAWSASPTNSSDMARAVALHAQPGTAAVPSKADGFSEDERLYNKIAHPVLQKQDQGEGKRAESASRFDVLRM